MPRLLRGLVLAAGLATVISSGVDFLYHNSRTFEQEIAMHRTVSRDRRNVYDIGAMVVGSGLLYGATSQREER